MGLDNDIAALVLTQISRPIGGQFSLSRYCNCPVRRIASFFAPFISSRFCGFSSKFPGYPLFANPLFLMPEYGVFAADVLSNLDEKETDHNILIRQALPHLGQSMVDLNAEQAAGFRITWEVIDQLRNQLNDFLSGKVSEKQMKREFDFLICIRSYSLRTRACGDVIGATDRSIPSYIYLYAGQHTLIYIYARQYALIYKFVRQHE